MLTARGDEVSGPFYEAAQSTLAELANVLGLTLAGPTAVAQNGDGSVTPFIDLLIDVRADLRTAKQWALSDKIRDSLQELGVALEDTRDGTNWHFQDQ